MSKITVTKGELLNMVQAIKTLQSNKLDKAFAYGLKRNIARFKEPLKSIIDMSEPDEDFKKYDEERKIICESFAETDELGNPKQTPDGRNFAIDPKRQDEFDSEIKKLREEKKEILKAHIDKLNAANKALGEDEIEVECYKISFKSFPEDELGKFTDILDPLIKETEEEVTAIIEAQLATTK